MNIHQEIVPDTYQVIDKFSVGNTHPISTFDVSWQPEILSSIARLAAGLYYSILSPQNMRAFQRTGSRIFSNEKLPQFCLELSIFEVNEQEITTEDKNLDLQIDFAINDTRCALCECEKYRVRTNERVPFTAHAVGYIR